MAGHYFKLVMASSSAVEAFSLFWLIERLRVDGFDFGFSFVSFPLIGWCVH
jgi:hypothetical protein